ncbi:glycosyltransferase family 4 protein [Candidatus Omnitrophota bacterium]
MNILFVYQAPISFAMRDLEILKSVHCVREFRFRGLRSVPLLWKEVRLCDATFSWFGKLNAFFAVLFSRIMGKRSVVVAGGDDATKYTVDGKPYGLFASPVKKHFAYFIFNNADLVLPVSKFTMNELLLYTRIDPDKAKLSYNAFDPDVFRKDPGVKKDERSITTVALIGSDSYARKGLRLFVDTARLLPDYRFTVVGSFEDECADHLKNGAPENVVFPGGLYGSDLVTALSKASVYVQASEWESFGCSLAEAMLCECVPVVSDRTAIPEVVGECGFYVKDLQPEELAQKIVEASQNLQVGSLARKRIIDNFSLEKRKAELLEAMGSLSCVQHKHRLHFRPGTWVTLFYLITLFFLKSSVPIG